MDPLTAAGSFASIVGLVANFASGRGHQDVLEIREFMEWLRFHGHHEVLAQIESNAAATASIKAALSEGKHELLARLGNIESLLTALTIDQGSLHALAVSVNPARSLSPQSIAILHAFEQASAGKALLMQDLEGESLIFLDGARQSSYSPSEPRFFLADLKELVELQLLEADRNGQGKKLFLVTRRGATVASALGAGRDPSGTRG